VEAVMRGLSMSVAWILSLLLAIASAQAAGQQSVDPAAVSPPASPAPAPAVSAAPAATPIPLSTSRGKSHATPHVASPLASPAPAADAKTVTVSGKADDSVPGWSIVTTLPPGWTGDCCQYARAIGVNLVLYQGGWTGNPDRVMVLNVWPRKLATLKAEWQADQANYLKKDPRAKVGELTLPATSMTCHGVLYQGSDHVDDLVVFCDPGKATGIRLSWSMTLAANDAQRASVMALFQQVIASSRYTKYQRGDTTTSRTSPP
jgi:hypothetical protein